MRLWPKRYETTAGGGAVTASAAKIPDGVETKGRRVEDWQNRAWNHYDEVPEVWIAVNYEANALRRIRLYPATQPDPQEPPVPLEPTGSLGARAHAELDRLRSVDGTHGQIIHDASIQFTVPGEGYLALYMDPNPESDAEISGVFSTSELYKNSDGRWRLRDGESTAGTEIRDPTVSRIWRPHPRFRMRSDSSMRPLAATFDELILLDQLYRSNARSRVPSGILLWPGEAEIPRTSTNDNPASGEIKDPLLRDYINAVTAPLSDEASVANVAPPMIKMKGDRIEQVKHLMFGREFDSDTAARYDRLIKRAATGMEIATTLITGMEDANHWSLWLIDEDEFDTYLAPKVQLICSAFTEGFFRPAMMTSGVAGAEDVFIWFDPAELLSHPNKAKDAIAAYDRIEISGETLRRVIGFSEDDAPDDVEKQERLDRMISTTPGRSSDSSGGEQAPPAEEGSPVQASAAPAAGLGRELARREAELRARLLALADGAVSRALSAAGAELRLRVQPHEALALRVQNVADRDAAAALGRSSYALAAGDDDLMDGPIDAMAAAALTLISRAQRRLRSTLRRLGLDEDQLQTLEKEQEDDAARAVELVRGGVWARASALLFAQRSEDRAVASVGTTLVRQALAVAGGAFSATVSHPVGDHPQGGVFTGETALDALRQVELTPNAWEWVYGDSERPFPAHEDLDGVEFLDWQDAILTVRPEDAWLGIDYYQPGDHDGCNCDYAPVFGEEQ